MELAQPGATAPARCIRIALVSTSVKRQGAGGQRGGEILMARFPIVIRGRVSAHVISALLLAAGSVACGGGDPAQAVPPGGMPPTAVKTLTVAERPTPRRSD